MQLDERKVVLSAILAAAIGITLLFFLSETPRDASIASALVAQENSLLRLSGTVENVSSGKFSLCERLCISVRASGIPMASLLYNGRKAGVLGRVKEYRNSRYMEAERIYLQ